MANGRQAAAELWQAASGGQFKLDDRTAYELAAHFQWFADEMVRRQTEVSNLQALDGFGGFVSAQHLQHGFEEKAVQAFNALKAAEESAYRMKAAVLQAAGKAGEVEAANTAAIQAASRSIPDVKKPW
ncbi:hypothetical protein [Nocardia transvalensis]|uniref:hypothetical protein n=1 Tax=Nocardia transvalensis TaxID=37333 RepID=UPI0018948329|nr:hypothetical protein [Nocardia transvalensis]MBF6330537.1 hypothetical protein [Nocardia transvalensis]